MSHPATCPNFVIERYRKLLLDTHSASVERFGIKEVGSRIRQFDYMPNGGGFIHQFRQAGYRAILIRPTMPD